MHTRKRILSILNFVIFLVYFTMLGIATPFLSSVPTGEGGFDTILSENDMYKMIDNFYAPEDFSDFREKPENINMLASFYNELQMSDKFEVVTSFNQAIYVDDFKGDTACNKLIVFSILCNSSQWDCSYFRNSFFRSVSEESFYGLYFGRSHVFDADMHRDLLYK